MNVFNRNFFVLSPCNVSFLCMLFFALSSCSSETPIDSTGTFFATPTPIPSSATPSGTPTATPTASTSHNTPNRLTGDVVLAGTLSLNALPPEVVGEGLSLAKRDVMVVDKTSKTLGKASTGTDGSFAVIVPGSLLMNPVLLNFVPRPLLRLFSASPEIHLESIISDTDNGAVIGVQKDIDYSSSRDINLGEASLEKITAIRGTAQLDGARDHTGTVVYIPGTSYIAHTDAAGHFLMTFLGAGS